MNEIAESLRELVQAVELFGPESAEAQRVFGPIMAEAKRNLRQYDRGDLEPADSDMELVGV